MTLFDAHCHYEDARFNEDRHTVLKALPLAGVCGAVDAGCTVEDSKTIQELSHQYKHLYFCAGVHPEQAHPLSAEEWHDLSLLWQDEKCVGVGEIGLDYHWEDNPPKAVQQEMFARLLQEAAKRKMRPVIHTRDAVGDMLAMLKEQNVTGALMHCFSESNETAAFCLDRDMYFSFGGTCTFHNARRANENLCFIPRDRILLETDSPYLAPVPQRGERNDSRKLSFIATHIAELWQVSAEEVARITTENAMRFYGLYR